MFHSFVFVFVVGSYCWTVCARGWFALQIEHDDLFVTGFVWLFIPASAWYSVSTQRIVVLIFIFYCF